MLKNNNLRNKLNYSSKLLRDKTQNHLYACVEAIKIIDLAKIFLRFTVLRLNIVNFQQI